MTDVGERYRDNSIVAWGLIAADGSTRSDFGIQSVTRNSVGNYTIVLDASVATAGNLCPIVTVELDAPPTSASSVRIASVGVVTENSLNVYINNGNYSVTDNDFSIMVTGR